jgi:hypothetical protein
MAYARIRAMKSAQHVHEIARLLLAAIMFSSIRHNLLVIIIYGINFSKLEA